MKILFFILLTLLLSCDKKPTSEVTFRDLDNLPPIDRLEKKGVDSELDYETLPLTFANLKKHILDPKCTFCHSGDDAEPSFDPIIFTSYDSTINGNFIPLLVKGDAENSSLYKAVASGDMPPKTKNDLNDAEVDYVKRWIDACAPETEDDIVLDGPCN
jgi:uncharacterized membrane protein